VPAAPETKAKAKAEDDSKASAAEEGDKAARDEGEAESEEAQFDAEAATEALDSAAVRASACRQPDDPSGIAIVTVTFAPSGRVTTATIAGPPFAQTPTSSCIVGKMRAARVPRFSGGYITVKRTVTIH